MIRYYIIVGSLTFLVGYYFGAKDRIHEKVEVYKKLWGLKKSLKKQLKENQQKNKDIFQ